MAQTGYTPIYLYYSGTATHIPLAANLGNGELAINAADGNLFYKNTSNAVVTIPVLQSSSTQSGWLSSTDWNTFNNKAPAGAYLTSVTADSPLTGAGTSASHLSMPAATGSVNGYLTSTDWTTFNSKQPAGTYVTSVSGTAPVVSSGGTTPAISMAAATGSVNGYLTSTDWTTFNGKQAALVSGTNIKTVSGTTLLGSGDLGTIGTGYGGTGLTSFTSTGVVYASSTSALATGSILTFDGTNVLTLGTASQSYAQYIVNSSGNSQVRLHINGSFKGGMYSTGTGITVASNSQINFSTDSGATASMSLDASNNLNVSVGNLVIGTSGKGIDFSATPGTGTSELLADYEEGTWTPTLTTDGTDFTSVTYTIQAGAYTKIGNRVICDATIYTSAVNKGSASGNIRIGGLPFTQAFTSARPSVNVGVAFSWAVSNPTSGEVQDSSTYINLNTRLTSSGGTSNVTVTDVGTGSNNFIRVSVSYFV